MTLQELVLRNTPIYVGDEALNRLKDFLLERNRIFFLADFRTMRKCLPIIETLLPEEKEVHTLVIQEGERFKNINTCLLLWKQLQELEAGRNDLFVNVGGGVVCDIGAFVATTFKRGMDFINVPTSLMAMSDAAIGGKSGVDLENVKNQVGLFTDPLAIYIYPGFLKSLDRRQLINGFAEIIKHALIADTGLWKDISNLPDPASLTAEMLNKSVKVKVDIVADDFKEKNKRKILNFGHTIGHALESYSLKHDQHPILHGEAVALGMICEIYLSTQKNGLSNAVLEKVSKYIFKYFTKYSFSINAIPELIKLIRQDKKNIDDKISLSLLKEIGKCDYDVFCTEADIVTALNVYHDLKF